MEVTIEIDRIVLKDFDNHDSRQIGASLKLELARLIKENGLPRGAQKHEISSINVSSPNLPKNLNPRIIGTNIARLVYKELAKRP